MTDLYEAPAHTDEEPPTGDSLQLVTKTFAFQTLLEKAATVVPNKDIQPVLRNFLIEAETGSIRVAATDLALSIVARGTLVVVQKPGSCVLPAAKMLSIVREAEDGDLTIQVADGLAEITVGHTTWKLRVADSAEYPPMPDEGDLTFTEVERAPFVAALSAVKYAVCKDSLKPGYMMVDVSKGRMRASDGVRFQQVPVPEGTPDIQIPGAAVDDLLKMLRATEVPKIEVGLDEYQLVFRVGMDVFIASRMSATFPDVDEVLLKPTLANDRELVVDRGDLVSAIRRVRITADEETNAVSLYMDGDGVLVSAGDKYGSASTTAIDGTWEGDGRKASFNCSYLLEMLQQSDDKSISLWFGKGTASQPSPVLVKGSNGAQGVLHQLYAGK